MCHFLAPAGQPEVTHKSFMRRGFAHVRGTVPAHEVFMPGKEDTCLNRKYIAAVAPLPDHILQVDFVSGSRLLLDMKPYLDKFRFRPLSDPGVWNSAVTNGIFIRFGNVELSHDEVLTMAGQDT